MTSYSAVSTAVILIGLAACVTDVRAGRIPNLLTLGSAAVGILFHLSTAGVGAAAMAASGWLVGGLIFLPFFALRGMGGGDVKLMAALGAWLGPREILWLAAYSAIAGGAIGTLVAMARGYLGTALRNIRGLLVHWGTVGLQPVPDLTLESARSPRLAYAIPILVGTLVTLWR